MSVRRKHTAADIGQVQTVNYLKWVRTPFDIGTHTRNIAYEVFLTAGNQPLQVPSLKDLDLRYPSLLVIWVSVTTSN